MLDKAKCYEVLHYDRASLRSYTHQWFATLAKAQAGADKLIQSKRGSATRICAPGKKLWRDYPRAVVISKRDIPEIGF